MALQALSGSGVGKVKIVPVLLEKVSWHSCVFVAAERMHLGLAAICLLELSLHVLHLTKLAMLLPAGKHKGCPVWLGKCQG